jgi:hypothetical protein
MYGSAGKTTFTPSPLISQNQHHSYAPIHPAATQACLAYPDLEADELVELVTEGLDLEDLEDSEKKKKGIHVHIH